MAIVKRLLQTRPAYAGLVVSAMLIATFTLHQARKFWSNLTANVP